jgi:succinate-semialdehyde dehydrogenase
MSRRAMPWHHAGKSRSERFQNVLTDVPAASTAIQSAISICPASGEEIARYPFHDRAGREQILAAAFAGQPRWAAMATACRARTICRVGEELRRQIATLAPLICAEMGKPIRAAREEIEKSAKLCFWYAENAEHLLAEETADVGNDGSAAIAFLPLGVILGVMPWNFPFWQVLRAAIPILLAGNAFLLKHADNVQGCAAALQRVMAAAGLPDGIFGVINVGPAEVAEIVGDCRVAAVTVTAGVAAGSAIGAEAGRHLKKSVLELGGSDPFIVLADADLDRAVPAAVEARFQNAGQVCIAAKRLIVERPIADEFVARLIEAAARLRVGNPLDERSDLGPLARTRLRTELHGQVCRSIDMGAKLMLGGAVPEGPGAFYPPTILTGITRDMPVWREETFGPVAPIMAAEDAQHAVQIANDSEFGLSGAIWSGDAERASRLARMVATGGMFINGVAASDPRVPIGGIRKSGYGRELSHFGLREFTNAQLVWARC